MPDLAGCQPVNTSNEKVPNFEGNPFAAVQPNCAKKRTTANQDDSYCWYWPYTCDRSKTANDCPPIPESKYLNKGKQIKCKSDEWYNLETLKCVQLNQCNEYCSTNVKTDCNSATTMIAGYSFLNNLYSNIEYKANEYNVLGLSGFLWTQSFFNTFLSQGSCCYGPLGRCTGCKNDYFVTNTNGLCSASGPVTKLDNYTLSVSLNGMQHQLSSEATVGLKFDNFSILVVETNPEMIKIKFTLDNASDSFKVLSVDDSKNYYNSSNATTNTTQQNAQNLSSKDEDDDNEDDDNDDDNEDVKMKKNQLILVFTTGSNTPSVLSILNWRYNEISVLTTDLIANCAAQTGQNTCSSCNQFFYPSPSGDTCTQGSLANCSYYASEAVCSLCNSGYALKEGSCVACPADCLSCSAENKCEVCSGSKNWKLSQQACVTEVLPSYTCISNCSGSNCLPNNCSRCDAGFYKVKDACSGECPSNCNFCKNNNQCYDTGCAEGFSYAENTKQCVEGVIANCKEVYVRNDQLYCKECKDEYVETSDGTCVLNTCDYSSCKECDAAGLCKSCRNYYWPDPDAPTGSCTACTATDKNCKKCYYGMRYSINTTFDNSNDNTDDDEDSDFGDTDNSNNATGTSVEVLDEGFMCGQCILSSMYSVDRATGMCVAKVDCLDNLESPKLCSGRCDSNGLACNNCVKDYQLDATTLRCVPVPVVTCDSPVAGCKYDQLCVCEKCEKDYSYDFVNKTCIATPTIANCDKVGAQGCTQCDKGFIRNYVSDLFQCAAQTDYPNCVLAKENVCVQCVSQSNTGSMSAANNSSNYVLNSSNLCVNPTCNLTVSTDFCAGCNSTSPDFCDSSKCVGNSVFDSTTNLCVECEVANCRPGSCSNGKDTCDVCNQGYTLETTLSDTGLQLYSCTKPVEFNAPSHCKLASTADNVCDEDACQYKYYWEDGLCLKCGDKCLQCTGVSACNKCVYNFGVNKGVCSSCSLGCKSCSFSEEGLEECLEVSNDYIFADAAIGASNLSASAVQIIEKPVCPVIQGCKSQTECGTCDECTKNYTLLNGQCVECKVDNCAACVSPNFCGRCDARRFLDSTLGVCSKCMDKCLDCKTADTCEVCKSKYEWVDGATECTKVDNDCYDFKGCDCAAEANTQALADSSVPFTCQECRSGYALYKASDTNTLFVNDVCVKCKSSIKNCASCAYTEKDSSLSLTCSKCREKYLPSADGSTCDKISISNCVDVDFESNPPKCKECSKLTKLSEDRLSCDRPPTCASIDLNCSKCSSGTCERCKPFQADPKQNNNTCVDCTDVNCMACSTPGVCKLCNSGFDTIDGSCVQKCSNNCAECNAEGVCSKCREVFAMDELSYYLNDSNECVQFTDNILCVSGQSETFCTLCKTGYWNKEGQCVNSARDVYVIYSTAELLTLTDQELTEYMTQIGNENAAAVQEIPPLDISEGAVGSFTNTPGPMDISYVNTSFDLEAADIYSESTRLAVTLSTDGSISMSSLAYPDAKYAMHINSVSEFDSSNNLLYSSSNNDASVTIQDINQVWSNGQSFGDFSSTVGALYFVMSTNLTMYEATDDTTTKTATLQISMFLNEFADSINSDQTSSKMVQDSLIGYIKLLNYTFENSANYIQISYSLIPSIFLEYPTRLNGIKDDFSGSVVAKGPFASENRFKVVYSASSSITDCSDINDANPVCENKANGYATSTYATAQYTDNSTWIATSVYATADDSSIGINFTLNLDPKLLNSYYLHKTLLKNVAIGEEMAATSADPDSDSSTSEDSTLVSDIITDDFVDDGSVTVLSTYETPTITTPKPTTSSGNPVIVTTTPNTTQSLSPVDGSVTVAFSNADLLDLWISTRLSRIEEIRTFDSSVVVGIDISDSYDSASAVDCTVGNLQGPMCSILTQTLTINSTAVSLEIDNFVVNYATEVSGERVPPNQSKISFILSNWPFNQPNHTLNIYFTITSSEISNYVSSQDDYGLSIDLGLIKTYYTKEITVDGSQTWFDNIIELDNSQDPTDPSVVLLLNVPAGATIDYDPSDSMDGGSATVAGNDNSTQTTGSAYSSNAATGVLFMDSMFNAVLEFQASVDFGFNSDDSKNNMLLIIAISLALLVAVLCGIIGYMVCCKSKSRGSEETKKKTKKKDKRRLNMHTLDSSSSD